MDLFTAIEQRNAALAQVAENAGSEFNAKARRFVLAYLRDHGPTPGEVLTNQAKADGIVPHNDKAFGPVYLSLSKAGLIVRAGFCQRAKGNATHGGSVWRLA